MTLQRTAALAVFALVLSSGCVSTTDLATLEADINTARRVAFENRKDVQTLKSQLGSTGSESASFSDVAEAFKNIRASQSDLYRRIEDLERSFQQITGQAEDMTFQNAQNLRAATERIDALSARLETLERQVAATGLAPTPGTAGATLPGGIRPAQIVPAGGTDTATTPLPLPGQPASTGTEPITVPGYEPPVAAVEPVVSDPPVTTPGATVGVSPVSLYRRGHEFLEKKQFSEARKVFQRFLREFGDHTYAGNAQYWLAETYYAEKNYEDAILAYEDVIRKFKGSDKVPGAMLKQGFSFLGLRDTRTGTVLLESVIRKYPDSDEADLARKKLKAIKKSPGSG